MTPDQATQIVNYLHTISFELILLVVIGAAVLGILVRRK